MFIDFDNYTRNFRISNSTISRDNHIYIMEFLALSNFQAEKRVEEYYLYLFVIVIYTRKLISPIVLRSDGRTTGRTKAIMK